LKNEKVILAEKLVKCIFNLRLILFLLTTSQAIVTHVRIPALCWHCDKINGSMTPGGDE